MPFTQWADRFMQEANGRLGLEPNDCIEILPSFLDGYVLRIAQYVGR